MREIKFRAYYQKITDDTWIIEGEYTLKDLTDRGIKFDQVRIDWVEYTGLKDNSGVEIYEGDILRPIIINGIIADGEVIFKDGCFEVQQITNNGLPLYDCLGTRTNFEIIGNIYEQKHLLK